MDAVTLRSYDSPSPWPLYAADKLAALPTQGITSARPASPELAERSVIEHEGVWGYIASG